MQIREKVPERLKHEILFVFALPVVGTHGELKPNDGEKRSQHFPFDRFAVLQRLQIRHILHDAHFLLNLEITANLFGNQIENFFFHFRLRLGQRRAFRAQNLPVLLQGIDELFFNLDSITSPESFDPQLRIFAATDAALDGAERDGALDGAVVRPRLGFRRGDPASFGLRGGSGGPGGD